MRGIGLPLLIGSMLLTFGQGCTTTPPVEHRPVNVAGTWEGQSEEGLPVKFVIRHTDEGLVVTRLDFEVLVNGKPFVHYKNYQKRRRLPVEKGRFTDEGTHPKWTYSIMGLVTGQDTAIGRIQWSSKLVDAPKDLRFNAVRNPNK